MGRQKKKKTEAQAEQPGTAVAGDEGPGDALTDEEFERYLAEQKADMEKALRDRRATAAEAPAPPPPPRVPGPPQPPAMPQPPQVMATYQPPPAPVAPPPPPQMPTVPEPSAPAQGIYPPQPPPPPQVAAPTPPTPTPAPPPAPFGPAAAPAAGFNPSAPPHPAVAPPPQVHEPPRAATPLARIMPSEIPEGFLGPIHPQDAQTERLTIKEYPLIASGETAMAAMQFNLGGGFGFTEWQLPRIKVPTGGQTMWSIPTPTGPQGVPAFAAVVLYCKDQRSFWSQSMDDTGGGSPPDCYSDDGVFGRGNPGGPCVQCRWSQWGSMAEINPRHKDSRGQACRHTTMIFLAMPGMMLPNLAIAPPTSLKLFKQYLFGLAQMGYPYFSVETVFGLHQTKVGNFPVSLINPAKHRLLEIDHRKNVWNVTQALMSIFNSVRPVRGEIEDT